MSSLYHYKYYHRLIAITFIVVFTIIICRYHCVIIIIIIIIIITIVIVLIITIIINDSRVKSWTTLAHFLIPTATSFNHFRPLLRNILAWTFQQIRHHHECVTCQVPNHWSVAIFLKTPKAILTGLIWWGQGSRETSEHVSMMVASVMLACGLTLLDVDSDYQVPVPDIYEPVLGGSRYTKFT